MRITFYMYVRKYTHTYIVPHTYMYNNYIEVYRNYISTHVNIITYNKSYLVLIIFLFIVYFLLIRVGVIKVLHKNFTA